MIDLEKRVASRETSQPKENSLLRYISGATTALLGIGSIAGGTFSAMYEKYPTSVNVPLAVGGFIVCVGSLLFFLNGRQEGYYPPKPILNSRNP
ncbi:hypothetical protein KW787_02910 [Candidatus Pacearchaeota archaeon]|nr:hypothetical protein [Candidatus Pacearchaeota archaeon]